MELPLGTIIVAGPVIIEDGKVLLNKEKKEYGTSKWFFPGGRMNEPDATPEAACIREVKEELGLDITIMRPMRTLLIDRPEGRGKAVLAHFLAQRLPGNIVPGSDIVEWGWHDIHNLPADCAQNVYEIVKEFIEETTL